MKLGPHFAPQSGEPNMSRAVRSFMTKWGIESEEELRDMITILQALMKLQFRRLRPKWSRMFGEDVLEAVERMDYNRKERIFVEFTY
jgi:hypothetical protein